MDSESSSSRHNKLESIIQDQSSEPHNIPLKDLKEVTDDFSDEWLLGQGGFGKVYKGVLRNGDMIAVKKLTWTMTGIHDKQYENEARLLMRLKHPNIVQLVGYCSETEKELVPYDGRYVYAEKSERLLCLEYLPKGSLRGHLSDASCGHNWDTRFKIIMGICYGLHYLHEEWQASTPIVHRDLKPSNILLDNNMVPKIADFGLSRLFGELQTRTITKNSYGTLGYMSPEYLNGGIITKELDIFSLGVIIIEIVTGNKQYPQVETSSLEFIDLVLKNWRNRMKKAPGYTSQEFDCQQIRRCIEIALLCVKLNRAERPTIRQIIKLFTPGSAEGSNESEACLIALMSQRGEARQRSGPQADEIQRPRSLTVPGNSMEEQLAYPCSTTSNVDQHTSQVVKKTKVQEKRHQVRGKLNSHYFENPVQDGLAWTMYGEKKIIGAMYPRLYYRCSNHRTAECMVTKKVQRTDMDPTLFDVIYQGEHTCVYKDYYALWGTEKVEYVRNGQLPVSCRLESLKPLGSP